MYLNKERFQLRRQRRDRLFYVGLYVVLIFGGLYINSLIVPGGAVQPIGVATPTATRSPQSYGEEAEKQFSAGQLAQAIEAYKRAIEQDPKRIDYWIRLARIQVYAGQAEEAVISAERAVFLDNNNSTAHAVHALALDWTSDYASASDAAVRAITLDTNNALAHAYYAEILVEQQRWAQARDESQLALSLDPNSMDAYRTYGYYLEATGNYLEAIEQYQLALKINPNLAFIYMKIGVLYRALAGSAETIEDQDRMFDLSIQYFQRASSINPNDTGPYISIARTYIQIGQYGAAAQYLEEALEIDPANAAVHAELGKVHFRNLNYENAIVELGCAVDSCMTDADTIDDEDGAQVYEVSPLALTPTTLDTFYIYSSVLSALSTPEDPYCQRAGPLIDQIDSWLQANDPENPFVFEILEENRNICLLAAGSTLAPDLNAEQTGTPDPQATPELTSTP